MDNNNSSDNPANDNPFLNKNNASSSNANNQTNDFEIDFLENSENKSESKEPIEYNQNVIYGTPPVTNNNPVSPTQEYLTTNNQTFLNVILGILLVGALLFGGLSVQKLMNKANNNESQSHLINKDKHQEEDTASIKSKFDTSNNPAPDKQNSNKKTDKVDKSTEKADLENKKAQQIKAVHNNLNNIEDKLDDLDEQFNKTSYLSSGDANYISNKLEQLDSQLINIKEDNPELFNDSQTLGFLENKAILCKTEHESIYKQLWLNKLHKKIDNLSKVLDNHHQQTLQSSRKAKNIQDKYIQKYYAKKNIKATPKTITASKPVHKQHNTKTNKVHKVVKKVKTKTNHITKTVKQKIKRNTNRFTPAKIAHNKHKATSRQQSKPIAQKTPVTKPKQCPAGYISDFNNRCLPANKFEYKCDAGYELRSDNLCHKIKPIVKKKYTQKRIRKHKVHKHIVLKCKQGYKLNPVDKLCYPN